MSDTILKKSIPVLFENGSCVVFDKPAGLLVIPTPKQEKNTLVDLVNLQFGTNAETGKLHPCHRLDRETSGAIIFAKGKKNQQLMMELFKTSSIKKKYIAFVHGRMEQKTGEFKSYIKDFDQIKYNRQSKPKLAITQYKVLEQKKNFSIVEVTTLTGRTNQIRIHFANNKHPLLGDRKYAFPRDYELKFKRVALHAGYLEWCDPLSKELIKIKSNLPKDMEVFLESK